MKQKILLTLICALAGALSALAANVPYALYSGNQTILTFYYGEMPNGAYPIVDSSNPVWHAGNTYKNVLHVVFDPSFAQARVKSTHAWFDNMEKLLTVDGLEYLNTEEVTDMSFMFSNCGKLTSLDLSHFNTSRVKQMRAMFQNCKKLTSINLSSFNTSNVENMQFMFNGCNVLDHIDVSGFNTSNVTNMASMFSFCKAFTSLNLVSFNTSKVLNMAYMFYGCEMLETIYAGVGWSTGAVNEGNEMFHGCTELKGGAGTTFNPDYVDFYYARIDGGSSSPGYFTGRQPEVVYNANTKTLTFYNDGNTHSGDVGLLPSSNTTRPWWSQDTNVSSNVQKVVFHPSFASVHHTSGYYWFAGMTNLTSIEGMEYFNTDEMVNMGGMFRNCSKLTSIDLSHFNTSKVTDMCALFDNCSNLTSIDLSNFDTGEVTSMSDLFYNCSKLTKLNLGNFNTAKVTDMIAMFSGCSMLTTINVDGDLWNTNAVTQSSSMFRNCTSIKGCMGTTYNANHIDKAYAHIDGGSSNPGYLSGKIKGYAMWDATLKRLTFYYDDIYDQRDKPVYFIIHVVPDWFTNEISTNATQVVFDPSFADARPTMTRYWFYSMTNLRSITGLEYLNTSEVTNMSSMFCDCSSLSSLDLSHFNTSKVLNMAYMFHGCKQLTGLDLSSFNTTQGPAMSAMFSDCENLVTIVVGDDWSTGQVTSSEGMFNNCVNILGCKGTKYNPAHVDKLYARIDRGSSSPGYLSDAMPRGFRYEGIWYDNGVVIAPQHGDNYTGEVVIPAKFVYKNRTYNVTHIEAGAFTGTSVTRVDLPGTINWIEAGAFTNATQLKKLVIGYASLPSYVNYEQNFTGGNANGFACYVHNSQLSRFEDAYDNINFAPWVQISESYYTELKPYRPFSCKYNTVMPSGLEAYYVKGYNSSTRTAQTQKVTGIVPASTGLLLKGKECKIYLLEKSSGTAATVMGNLLKPYLSAADSPVGVQDDNARFYFNVMDMWWESTVNLSLGSSYLCIPKSQVGTDLTSPVLLDLENSSGIPGDVNGDGDVTAADVTALYDVLLNNDYSHIVNGDQTGDDDITAADITAVYTILLSN